MHLSSDTKVSRRFADVSRPLAHVSAGEAISVWTAIILGIVAVIIAAAFFLSFFPKHTIA